MAPSKHKLVKHPASSQVAKPRTNKHKLKRQPTMVVSNAIQTVAVKPREEFNMSTLNGVTLKVTWAMDLKAGPDKPLKVDHQTMRGYIVPPD